MTSVAVIAHAGKTFGGGLDELRSELAHAGVDAPLWFEVPKSRKAPKKARAAVEAGADLVFVWGGDGMVQRCVDALADAPVAIAILPAGTANLFAGNLGIPSDIPGAVEVGLHGRRREFDVGRVNGERFVVMAGAGFDALMIRDADRGLKDKAGRLAYVWTGARHLRSKPVKARVRVDGAGWFKGKVSCVLIGNVGTIAGGLQPFGTAEPDDGALEVGVVTAKGAVQWSRVLARLAAGSSEKSPFTRLTSGRKIDVRFDEKVAYELDGGDRGRTKKLEVRIEPAAITVCVPQEAAP